MSINADKPHLWKQDVRDSVDLFNEWFLLFAPKAFRDNRALTTSQVEAGLRLTRDLTEVTPAVLREHPGVLQMLRMAACPPLARDRLVGLAHVSKALVQALEADRLPPRLPSQVLDEALGKIAEILNRMLDRDIFPWIGTVELPTEEDRFRAATIVADRLCGALSDPIIRTLRRRASWRRLTITCKPRATRRRAIPPMLRSARWSPAPTAFG